MKVIDDTGCYSELRCTVDIMKYCGKLLNDNIRYASETTASEDLSQALLEMTKAANTGTEMITLYEYMSNVKYGTVGTDLPPLSITPMPIATPTPTPGPTPEKVRTCAYTDYYGTICKEPVGENGLYCDRV